MIPEATTPIKIRIRGSLITFLRMIISGKDRPMTDIMNASDVPSDAPFSRRAWMIGMIPAAFE